MGHKKNKAKSIENDDEDTMNLPLHEGNFELLYKFQTF